MIVRFLCAPIAVLMLTSWADVPRPRAWSPVMARSAPLILGVNTHFGAKVAASRYPVSPSATAIRRAGFGSWRDVLSLPRFSRMRSGSQDEVATLSRFKSFARQSGAGDRPVLAALSWPAGGTADQDNYRAFAALLGQALPYYPPASMVEIWNEWDKGGAEAGDGSVQSYGELLKTTIPAIRSAQRSATILIGAAADDGGGLDFRWTRSLLRLPIARQADGVSVHAYNHCSVPRRTRAAADLIGRMDRLRADMVSTGLARMRIFVTEYGWPVGSGTCEISADDAASNLAQFTMLASSRPWIAGTWYYELKDSGQTAGDIESDFGLYDYRMSPKPAVCVAGMVNRLVARGSILRTYEGDDMTAVLMRVDGRLKTVAWATRAGSVVPVTYGSSAAPRPMCAPPLSGSGGRYRLGFRPTVFDGNLLAAAGAGGTSALR